MPPAAPQGNSWRHHVGSSSQGQRPLLFPWGSSELGDLWNCTVASAPHVKKPHGAEVCQDAAYSSGWTQWAPEAGPVGCTSELPRRRGEVLEWHVARCLGR